MLVFMGILLIAAHVPSVQSAFYTSSSANRVKLSDDHLQHIEIRVGSQTALANEAMCGPYCLFSVLVLEGHNASLADVVRRTPNLSAIKGCSLADLVAAIRTYGLPMEAGQFDLKRLQTARLPAILHTKSSHFVVALQANDQSVQIFDPTNGTLSDVSCDALKTKYSGYGLGWGGAMPTRRMLSNDVVRWMGYAMGLMAASWFILSWFVLRRYTARSS